MKKKVSKKIPVNDLVPIAKERIQTALQPYNAVISDEDRSQITLGWYPGDKDVIFELYVPCENPKETRIISRIILDRYNGTGEAKVYLDQYPGGVTSSKLEELEGNVF